MSLLAQPGQIGRLTLANRFIQSPLHPMLADADGHVTPEQLAYYRERALGGAALCITEYAFIDHAASRANFAQLSVADDHCLPGLARLAETIQHAGALAGMQISHAGRQRFLGVAPIVAPSRVPWEWLHATGAPVPTELTIEEIEEIVSSFGRAARRVRDAGFDLVELHAGHGYLVGQFLSRITNRRTDYYGGTLESRQRFLRDVIRSIRAGVGDDYPVTARLSGAEGMHDGITLDETIATARLLEGEGIAAIDISGGNHHTMELQLPPIYMPLATHAAAAHAVREAAGVPVSVVGSVGDPGIAEQLLVRGDADFVRLGRPLLADPHYPRKVLSGRPEAVRPCIRCNECLDRAIARRRAVRCAVNFRTGREALRHDRPAPLRLVVVGGGPAGLEAAAVAQEHGHTVSLFEREHLGGAINDAARPEFKSDLRRYRDWLVARARSGIDLRDQEAGPDELMQLEPDVVIVATGAKPLGADVDLRAALAAPEQLGDRVVVSGTNQFAAETAWHLAIAGKGVTLAGPELDVAADAGPHHVVPLVTALDELGIKRWLGCVELTVSDGVARGVFADGARAEIPCDTLVTSVYVPADEFGAAGPWQVVRIGDCIRPRRILDAIEDANVALMRL